MSIKKYPKIMIAVHWLMFLMISLQFAIGFVMEDESELLITGHIALGIAILCLVFVRIFFRYMKKSEIPEKPEFFSDFEWKVAKLGHNILYVMLVIVPLSGLTGYFSKNHDILEIHETLVFVFIALILGHVMIALKHQLIDKKDLFSRIL